MDQLFNVVLWCYGLVFIVLSIVMSKLQSRINKLEKELDEIAN